MKNRIKLTAVALAVLVSFTIASPSFAATHSSMMNDGMMKGMMHGKKMNMDGMMAEMDSMMKMCMKMMQADMHHKKA